MQQDSMMIVRGELVRRIDAIAAGGYEMGAMALCDQIDTIRRLARTHALDALESLASMLETAIGCNGHGPVIFSYLDLMRDAAACEMEGPDVRTRYAAALSVRLGA